MSTICAISTPNAVGGLSVIRISGEKSIEIAAKIFQPFSTKAVEKMGGYTCCFGKVVFNGEEIDEGILTVFRAPKSFTGENVCEISCHGGLYVTKQVLRAIISSGAKPAEAGEFTKRAFLNGKLSLTQAEAVMDMIMAQGEQSHRSAVSAHEGILFSRIKAMTDKLVSILGELAAWVDYPEEDLPEIEYETFENSLHDVLGQLNLLLESYDTGRILREGINTVIIGKPNVGKSTLMNMLLGFERSIVTDIAGTTRDIVEESVRLGDLVLRLSDTAGIHETTDTVEGVGVSLAFKKLNESDLIIAVFDNSSELSKEDFDIVEKIKDKPSVAVINKSDLEQKLDKDFLKDKFKLVIEISAKENFGQGELISSLEELFKINQFDANAGVITNERQRGCIENAKASLEKALVTLTSGETYDAVTVLIDEGANALLELTGEKATEAVVNDVFSRFCVGK